mmetsp:Transcript_2069/g.5541  ORF Transcript_2069/g.5541 Transcript_2069/m.5541 type:complete len:216 (-) Transcript_2069:428-1075(-)
MRVALHERRPRRLVRGVQNGAVEQDDAHILERVVRVLRHAAAHARGVVGDDSANHAAVNAAWIRPDFVLLLVSARTSVRRKQSVDLPTDEARLDGDLLSISVDGVVAEVVARVRQLHEHAVGDRLAGQRRSRGTEGDGCLVLVRLDENLRHLILVVHLDNYFGNEAVERRVRSVRIRSHGVRDDPLRRHDGVAYGLDERRVSSVVVAESVNVLVF